MRSCYTRERNDCYFYDVLLQCCSRAQAYWQCWTRSVYDRASSAITHYSANSTPLVPRTAITNLVAVAKISTIKQFHTMPSDSFTMLERWVTNAMQNTSFIAHIIGFLGNLPSERFHRQEQRSSVQRLVSSNVPVSPPASQRPLP